MSEVNTIGSNCARAMKSRRLVDSPDGNKAVDGPAGSSYDRVVIRGALAALAPTAPTSAAEKQAYPVAFKPAAAFAWR